MRKNMRRLVKVERAEIKRSNRNTVEMKGAKVMDMSMQMTNGQKASQALRELRSLIMKAQEDNPRTQEEIKKSLGKKYEE